MSHSNPVAKTAETPIFRFDDMLRRQVDSKGSNSIIKSERTLAEPAAMFIAPYLTQRPPGFPGYQRRS